MKKKFIGILMFIFILSSCSTQKYYLKSGRRTHKKPAHISKDFTFIFDGILGQKRKVGTRLCKKRGKRLKAIKTKSGFGNSILSIITLGIYAPKTHIVYCK